MDGKNTTYGALVEAVERYVNGSAYPSVDDICLILGIEMKKVKNVRIHLRTLRSAPRPGRALRLRGGEKAQPQTAPKVSQEPIRVHEGIGGNRA